MADFFTIVEEEAEKQAAVPTDREGGGESLRNKFSKSAAGSFIEGAAKGITFGTNDEIKAAIYSAFSPKTYEEELASVRGQDKATAKEHGIANVVGQVGGTVLPSLLSGGTAAPASLTRMAMTSGASSAAAAAGEAEGGASKRLDAALDGFFTGAATGAVVGKAFQGGQKVVKALTHKQPTTGALRSATNAAYDAVEASGDFVPAADLAASYNTISSKIRNDFFYNPDAEISKPIESALSNLKDIANKGKGMTFGETEQIVRSAWKTYKSTKNPHVLELINGLNDVMDATAKNSGSDLLLKAREASRIEQNVRMFDTAFGKAGRQTKSTFSGGNIDNKYRQAAQQIIDDPKRNRYLRPEEMAGLQKIVDGTVPTNIARRIGKSSPTGGGMMQMLWGLAGTGGYWHSPAALTAIAAGATGTAAAKEISDAATKGRVASARGILSGSPTPPINTAATGAVAQTAARAPGMINANVPLMEMTSAGATAPPEVDQSMIDQIIMQRLQQ